MRDDLVSLQQRTQRESDRYRAGKIEIDDVCFWYKSLIRAFLAQVEVLCNTMREAVAQLAPGLGELPSEKKLREISDLTKRMPIEKSFSLAFRFFPRLFGADFSLDTGGVDFRALKALVEARGRFTHPKKYGDLCPLEVFAVTQPAMEWFLLAWSDLLVSCVSALGLSLANAGKGERRFKFKDEKLGLFTELGERFESEVSEKEPLDYVEEVLGRLLRDSRIAFTLFKESNDPNSSTDSAGAARNLLRTAFSEIEGATFVAALHLNRFAEDYASPEEGLLIGSHDDVRSRIVQVLESFSKEFGSGVTVPRSGVGWNSFAISREVRNRLTHPKRTSDLEMNSLEVEAVVELLRWWHLEASLCLDV